MNPTKVYNQRLTNSMKTLVFDSFIHFPSTNESIKRFEAVQRLQSKTDEFHENI